MATDEQLQRIAASGAYRNLVERRVRFERALAAIMTLAWLGFLLLVAFDKALLAHPIGDRTTTWGIPIGLGLILLAWLLTALYVRRANGEYDAGVAAIRSENGA